MSDCKHSGYYSGVGLYSMDAQHLRYVLVCDDCGGEMKEISTVEYAPNPVVPPEIAALG
jgi:hypothetical protein